MVNQFRVNIDHSVLNVYSAQPMSRVLIQSPLRDWQLLIIIRHLSVDICSLYAAGHDVRRDGHQIAGDVCMRVTLSLSIARGKEQGEHKPITSCPIVLL